MREIAMTCKCGEPTDGLLRLTEYERINGEWKPVTRDICDTCYRAYAGNPIPHDAPVSHFKGRG